MRRDKTATSMIILVVLLMFITIGYAYLNTNLNINGVSNINSARWDIQFENIQVKSGSVTPTNAATINVNGNAVTYTITLSEPGDFYEFNVDVKNAGTIDGMIETTTSTVNGNPISSLPNYVEYSVTYGDGSPIQTKALLTAGTKHTYTIHVGYKKDISASQLPSTDQTLNMSFSVKETQADSTAIPLPTYVYSVSSDYFYIGEAVPNGVTTYDSYEEAVAAINKPFFMRHKIENNIITESNVGFVYNNNAYYLKTTPGTATFNHNLAVGQSAFGTARCEVSVLNDNVSQFYCAEGTHWTTLTIYFNEDGVTTAAIDGFGAYFIQPDSSFVGWRY